MRYVKTLGYAVVTVLSALSPIKASPLSPADPLMNSTRKALDLSDQMPEDVKSSLRRLGLTSADLKDIEDVMFEHQDLI